MLDTGELSLVYGVTRRHQEDKPLTGAVRENTTAGVDQTPGLLPVTPSSEGRPLLAVSGSSWGPVEMPS